MTAFFCVVPTCYTAVTSSSSSSCHQNFFKNTTINFTFKGPCIVKYMPIIVQQDATIYSLFISVNRSTCFGWYLHPSPAAHVTVSTASGISKTVIATCRKRDWTGTEFPSSHFRDRLHIYAIYAYIYIYIYIYIHTHVELLVVFYKAILCFSFELNKFYERRMKE